MSFFFLCCCCFLGFLGFFLGLGGGGGLGVDNIRDDNFLFL